MAVQYMESTEQRRNLFLVLPSNEIILLYLLNMYFILSHSGNMFEIKLILSTFACYDSVTVESINGFKIAICTV